MRAGRNVHSVQRFIMHASQNASSLRVLSIHRGFAVHHLVQKFVVQGGCRAP